MKKIDFLKVKLRLVILYTTYLFGDKKKRTCINYFIRFESRKKSNDS